MKFAKLFDMGDDQLLVRVMHNDDEDRDEVTFTSEINELIAEIKLGYNNEGKALEYFQSVDQEIATKMYNELKQQVDNLQEG